MNGRVASRVLAVLFLSVAGTACGDESDGGSGSTSVGTEGTCAKETRGQTYAAGLTYQGAAGLTVTLLDSNPAPPQVGDNVWMLKITDGAGAAVLGATVKLVPWQVEHDHGSPSNVVVTELDAGRYRAAPVNLSMPGFWDTTVSVTASSATDRVKIGFCVE